MKPAAFDYAAARSAEEAVGLLDRANGEARLLAGGQTLGPMLNMRLASPALLVDVGRIAALKRLGTANDRLYVGAAVTHATLEDWRDSSPLGRLLSHVASTIAYRAVRNRGTVGGSLAHADPAADWITTMTLLDAQVTIVGPAGRRQAAMSGFMRGAFATVIGPSEMLEGVDIAIPSAEARWGYYKVCRKTGEFPDAVGAVFLDPPRGVSRILVGALDGPPAPLPALAERVAREGAAAATSETVTAAVAEAAPGLDAVDLQLHAVAVRRAIHQAVAS
jgi:carbon-monoxide dehydrogenase medium subunit